MSSGHNVLIIYIVLISQLCILKVDALVPCFLCGVPDSLPSHKDCMIDDTGATCFDAYKSILISQDQETCDQNRTKYEEVCCSEGYPSLCYTGPTLPPVYVGETGNEPTCRLCGTDEYPGMPAFTFSTRYLGTYSCAGYYDRGLHGLIPAYLCGPLRKYAEEHCGCGGYNPDCISDPSKCYTPTEYSTATQPGHHDPVETPPEATSAFGLIVGICGAVFGLGVAFAYIRVSRVPAPQYSTPDESAALEPPPLA